MILLGTSLLFLGLFADSFCYRAKKANCVDTWSNVPNPCIAGNSKQIYHAHPTDKIKFIQCDLAGKMYIVQCPKGEVYNQTLGYCITGTVPTSATTHASTKAATIFPRTANPTTSTTTSTTTTTTTTKKPTPTGNIQNPCTPAHLAKNMTYFAHPQDPTKFIQCTLLGRMLIYPCQATLVWDQQQQSCVYNYNPGLTQSTSTTTKTPTSTVTITGTNVVSNPCTPTALAAGKLFHPHPDPHKFIQCDLTGHALVNVCPKNMVWNNYSKTCSALYLHPVG